MEIDQVTLDTSARAKMASICWPMSSDITTAKTEQTWKTITQEIKRAINLPIAGAVLYESGRKSNGKVSWITVKTSSTLEGVGSIAPCDLEMIQAFQGCDFVWTRTQGSPALRANPGLNDITTLWLAE